MTRLLFPSSLCVFVLVAAACNDRHATSDATPVDAFVPMDAAGDATAHDGATADLGATDGGHDGAVLDASAVDGGHDGSVAIDGSACSIVGDYTLTVMGTTVFIRFTATGTFAIAGDRASLDTTTMLGTYTFSGGMLLVNDADTTCVITDDGRYTVAFDSLCGFTLTLVSDACASRGMSLDGARLVRQP